MTSPRAAALYARISSDQEGAGLGVARQLADCRRLAGDMGWAVAEEYVDNDLSAYSGKARPAYERMLADLADGARDAVVVYHTDRLTRRPIELEQFVNVLSAASVHHVRFVAGGDLDVGNGDGLLLARMMSAVAANESATKSRRIRRKMDDVAASGMPHGGYTRPFGFEDDKITHRPHEAEIIRSLVARYLAGESFRSLTVWLDTEGIRTVQGGSWQSGTLRLVLSSARIAGLRSHRGQVVGPAVWEPIITAADRAKVLARMAERATNSQRSPRRYMLSGLLRCGRCGGVLFSAARQDVRRYVCSSGPDHRGCGRLTVVAPPVEHLIAEGVLYRLDTTELADALAGRAAIDEATATVAEQLSGDRAQLDELAAMYSQKAITAREWMAARNPIEARIQEAVRRLARATRCEALAGLPGNGAALRAQWDGLNLIRQHAIVSAVLDHAVILPGVAGAQALDPKRVEPRWRL
ncbi:MAG: recombinase family protein [Actinomycetota bacterium]|nr:recombinase family protein [Actinomycetota bacterium]